MMYKKAVLSQRWPRDACYISRSWAVAEIWPFEIIQDGGGAVKTDSWWQTVPEIYNTFSIKILPHTTVCNYNYFYWYWLMSYNVSHENIKSRILWTKDPHYEMYAPQHVHWCKIIRNKRKRFWHNKIANGPDKSLHTVLLDTLYAVKWK